MASGQPVVVVLGVTPPGANFARPEIRAGGSTPAERVNIWRFSPTVIEYLDLYCRLVGYGGGGLTIRLQYYVDTATTGVVRLGAALRRLQDDAEDLDTAHTYDFNDVDDTIPNVNGEPGEAVVTFTDGADMDSVLNGEFFILRVRRNATHANDTVNSNDCQLAAVSGTET